MEVGLSRHDWWLRVCDGMIYDIQAVYICDGRFDVGPE